MDNWFSNFKPYDVPLIEDGVSYPSPEHYFQAMKTKEPDLRIVAARSASYAKKLGRRAKLREDWEEVKIDVMTRAQVHRYRPGTVMRKRLLDTKNELIVEWNTWHDNTWGSCTCKKCLHVIGKNLLGEILMEIRDGLK